MAAMPAPSHILIVGSGVFGLSTAYALVRRPSFARTKITLVSPEIGKPTYDKSSPLPSSVDSNRIIRADYADPMYAELAKQAQALWREKDWGGDGKYTESGLLLTATPGSEGANYIREALINVRADVETDRTREVSTPKAVEDAIRGGKRNAKSSGDLGYINPASGWADAGRSVKDLEMWLSQSRRVDFVAGEVVRLIADESAQMRGVELASGKTINADSIILATGAWTPKLLDLRGIASTRAQVMAYFDLSDAEAEAHRDMPVQLNLSSGCFVFPPNQRSDGRWEIKAARHSYGYLNPVRQAAPLGAEGRSLVTSLPSKKYLSVASCDEAILSNYLAEVFPFFDRERRPTTSRLCYYLDTHKGDFIVGYHPRFNNLFLATGGSGHAFKFLPVIGEKVADIFERKEDVSAWTDKWKFPQRQKDDEVTCHDGSRSGPTNVVLEQIMMSDTDLGKVSSRL